MLGVSNHYNSHKPQITDPTIMPDINDKTTADAPSLADNEYHLIVAPVLQVAAELAAVRGDPELFNDMPSMLALRILVKRLGHSYLEQYPDTEDSLRVAIESAPDGACAMALKRAELDQVQSTDCMWSLNEAARQLEAAGVIGPEEELARDAWRQLCGGNRKHALSKLKLAAGGLVTAIDQWEQQRQAEADPAVQ